MSEETDAIHKAVSALSLLDKQDRITFFLRAKLCKELKDLKPHKKGFNGAKKLADFWASLGLKSSSVENAIRIHARFGELVDKHDLDVIPSRCQKALAIKSQDESAEYDLLVKCTSSVPYRDFSDEIRKAKGKPEQSSCDHSGEVENWRKCLDCQAWVRV